MYRFTALLLLAFWLCSAGQVSARVPDKKTARSMMALGHQYFAAKQYVKAIAALKKAYAAWPRHEIQFNVAYSYAHLNNKIAAVTHLRMFLKHATEAQRVALPTVLSYMLKHSAILIVRTLEGTAAIYVDGKFAGRGKIDKVVEPGKRLVEIKWNDKTVVRRTVEVFPGVERVWRVPRKPTSKPRPKTGSRSTSGRRRLHWAYVVSVSSVAAALAAAAVGTGLKTWDLRAQFDDGPTEALLDEGNRYRVITNVLWGVAGGAAVVAGILAIFTRWRKSKKTTGVTVAPHVGPGNVGLSVRGGWR
jgi:tetratricopeptide (TPR) repeat protein